MINKNYKILVSAIKAMQDSSLSLEEPLEIADKLKAAVMRLKYTQWVCVAEKYENLLDTNAN